MGFLCAGCCHLGCAWHPPPWHPPVGCPQSVPWLEGSLGVPAGSTSYQQEVCVSIALLRNCPKHSGKRCLVLQNRCSSQVLGNIYVTCLKNKKRKRGGGNPRKEEERQWEPSAATQHAQHAQHPSARVASYKLWEASQPPHRPSRGSSYGFNPDINHPNLQLGRVLFWSCHYICSKAAQSV